MAAVFDKLATLFAGKVFGVFYDTMRASSFIKDDKDSQLMQSLDAMKSIFSQKDKRWWCDDKLWFLNW